MSNLNENIDLIVEELLKKMATKSGNDLVKVDDIKEDKSILVEASGKHIHLCQSDVEKLFGKDYNLKKVRELSQPGQYLCEEKVTIIGPKGILSKVSVLGPTRKETQVELSLSDAVSIGIKAPVRMSGNIEGSAGAVITTGTRAITLQEGVIVAKRHIHLTPSDADRLGVHDKEVVKVKVGCPERGLIFDNVILRVSPEFSAAMHLDYDEANGCGYLKNMRAVIQK